MGDGVLAYFGYPQAHEEDPERAVRAALDLVQAVHALTPRPELALQVRVGIATGLVVVGDLIGEGAAKEQAVVGNTPNLAARLQELAEPGERRDQRRDPPPGRQPVRVRGPRARSSSRASPSRCGSAACAACARSTASRPCAPASRPLIGREQEIALLLERWRGPAEGEGHVVVLSGEPGVGKSRIVLALQEQLAGEQPRACCAISACRIYRNSPLQPVIEELERTAGIGRDDDQAAQLDKLRGAPRRSSTRAGSMTPLLAALLVDPDRGARRRRSRSRPSGARPRRWMRSCSGSRAHGRAPAAAGRVRGRALDRSDVAGSCSSAWSTARAMPPVLVLITRRPEAAADQLRPGQRHRADPEPAEPAPDRDADRRADRRPSRCPPSWSSGSSPRPTACRCSSRS